MRGRSECLGAQVGCERLPVAAAVAQLWIAGGFVPTEAQVCVLRSYLRHREHLVQQASTQIQLMQKALTQMNVQLHHVLSDVTGVTGMAILDAIVEGNEIR